MTWACRRDLGVLPNAAIPTVTIIGFMVGSLVAGAVVVESVFSWPGVGSAAGVGRRQSRPRGRAGHPDGDRTWMVMANLTVDLAYGWLDPRVRGTAAAH